MKVTSQPLEDRQVELNVEMEADELDKYMTKAYQKLVGRVRVPGFRKGKVPRTILEKHIGRDAFLQEAIEFFVPEAYQKAVEEQNIVPIAQPEIEITETEPITFKAVIPLEPEVKLGDYAQVRLEQPSDGFNEEDVDKTIDQIRHEHATLLPVERPVEIGDVVTMDIEFKREGEPPNTQKDVIYEVVDNSSYPLPGFAEKLKDMKKGVEKSFTLSYPPDYEVQDLADKEFSFTVAINEIKEKKLPEINDDLAKFVESESIDALREQIRSNLKQMAEEKTRIEYEKDLLEKVAEISEMKYPPVLVEDEISRMINEEARNFSSGIDGLHNYLKTINKTMEDHREELKPTAEQRLIRSLVVSELSKSEKIEVSKDEIDQEIDKMANEGGGNVDEIRKIFDLPQARNSIEQVLISRKTVDRLKHIANGSSLENKQERS
jgi:trigger factor